jgi:hypothetical protein
MKKSLFAFTCLLVLLVTLGGLCQTNVRTEIAIPDIPGYLTLACDFHMHTVFSDGKVWPTVRPEEAWMEGLDAIAITDHIEYLPHKDDVKTEDFNRSFELAKETAAEHQILLIKGAEITRDMPPGHFNAIFLQDANALNKKDWKEALKAAVDQEAFIFWNHPGWKQPGTVPMWYPEHTELFGSGWVRGMEIVNDREYYPKAFEWCLEKNITMLGNSDVHDPIHMVWDFQNGEHRPMTLVFATEKTEKAIKEALLAGRTAVYNGKYLLGREQYLEPIFEGSVRTMRSDNKGGNITIQIHNSSCVTFELDSAGKIENVTFPERLTLYAGKTILFKVKIEQKQPVPREIDLPYVVRNLLVAPNKGLPVRLNIHVSEQK